MESIILATGFIYFVGHLLTHFFERSKVPDVLMLILFGIVVGPLTGIMTVDRIGSAGYLFTQFALIIILFQGGLDIEIGNLVRSARQSVIMTTAFFGLSAAAIWAVMRFGFDYSPMAAAVTGFICGGTSSAVVIPLLRMIRASKKAGAMLVIESALTDVLCIVFTIGALQSITSGEFKVGRIVYTLVTSLVIASAIGLVGGVFWLKVINWVRGFSNTRFATCFFMFVIYGVAEIGGFSGAIAALAFGIVMGNARMVSHRLSRIYEDSYPTGVISDAEKGLYEELAFLVKIFFFIYLGISIPFESSGVMAVAISIVAALFAMRPFCAMFLTGRQMTPHDKSITAVMLPKGLAAAVLAGLPGQYGMIEGPDIQAITYHVVLDSIIVTSILIPLVERTHLGARLDKIYSRGEEAGAQKAGDHQTADNSTQQ